MKKRLSWIDIARGIGIIAVLYGHALSGDSLRHLLYAFHMPLFFFLSGIVFDIKRHSTFLPFLQKNARTILLPYVFFALLSYLIWLSARTSLPSSTEMLTHAKGILYANSSGLFFNIVLWFLPTLFVTKILFWFIAKVTQTQKQLLIILAVFAIVGYVVSLLYAGVKLPLGLETAITAVVFYGLGYTYIHFNKIISDKIRDHTPWIFVGGVVSMIVLASINFEMYGYQIDMRLNKYSNVFLFYGAAISGIVAVLAASISIQSHRLLEYIGKQSLPLFVWHVIVFTYLTKFARTILSPQVISEQRNITIAPIFTIVAIFLILATIHNYQRIIHSLQKIRVTSRST